ncbi:MAG: hypothetical protein M0Z28_13330 [Rhodospirillales bacterium]|nr:hypothetical protein [Rhodospirillales bacterium]
MTPAQWKQISDKVTADMLRWKFDPKFSSDNDPRDGGNIPCWAETADSDEVGHAFQFEAGH